MVSEGKKKRHPSSFRDSSGFVFSHRGEIHRQVNKNYAGLYSRMMTSGLYETLTKKGMLIPHSQEKISSPAPKNCHAIIKPVRIPFVSYPYEWCFSQLKRAALLTLSIQEIAIEYGMVLKDASAYNIQFLGCRPVFIDTLSFGEYRQGAPWVAYRQFCQHFLAPLLLMVKTDIRLNQLFRIYMDGIPLDLASSLLPFCTRFSPSLNLHIHTHAKAQKRYAESEFDQKEKKAKRKTIRHNISRNAFMGLVNNLKTLIRKLVWKPEGTEWGNYYQDTNYADAAMQFKKQIISNFLADTNPVTVWDLGGNTGTFSRIASDQGIKTVCFDIDPAAVEKNFLMSVERKEGCLLPLLLDATNPSPDIGWQNRERTGLIDRGPADTVFALAVIHHLAISNNVPLAMIAEFFAGIARNVIIEFVPKQDSQVQRLLASREDIFPDYCREGFEHAFKQYFHLEKLQKVSGSERIIYLFRKK